MNNMFSGQKPNVCQLAKTWYFSFKEECLKNKKKKKLEMYLVYYVKETALNTSQYDFIF